ncbi:sigma-70 family RNA polymerase sigma factor [Clostridium ganghwense]|uniref:Sigma-70 family RNA polymerase sigma factor n=1 Tax=Clostridium ganghwense TaxID=312089 RepID=A0ABT4CPJ5_9CLOT|nr:sigma-70 family RNA polymerase sigma factor [Clostridium ganghwense]MCY6370971.1 sigma-70 family RNA polymerase sigma factor [Clostridium ganghwense]
MKGEVDLDELVEKAKLNDKEAAEEIINRFTKYVAKTASGIYIKGYEMEDIKQIGYLSIMKAIKLYDSSKNKNFTAYLIKTIKNNYYNNIRKMSKRNYEASLDKIIECGMEKEVFYTSYNIEYNIEEEYIKKEKHWEFGNMLDKLPAKDRELVEYIYKNERGAMVNYAKIKNMKYQACCKRKNRVIKKMAIMIKEENNKNI